MGATSALPAGRAAKQLTAYRQRLDQFDRWLATASGEDVLAIERAYTRATEHPGEPWQRHIEHGEPMPRFGRQRTGKVTRQTSRVVRRCRRTMRITPAAPRAAPRMCVCNNCHSESPTCGGYCQLPGSKSISNRALLLAPWLTARPV